MGAVAFAIWFLGVSSAVAVFMFLAALCRVWRGERFKVFLWQCVLMTLANTCYLIEAIGLAIGFIFDKRFLRLNNINGIGFSLGNLFFSEAHWVMAVYYMRIAHNVPKQMDGLHDQLKDYSRILCVGVVLSAICPLLDAVDWTIIH